MSKSNSAAEVETWHYFVKVSGNVRVGVDNPTFEEVTAACNEGLADEGINGSAGPAH